MAFTFDEKGICYVAETFRMHHGVTDTRGHMNWLDDMAVLSAAGLVLPDLFAAIPWLAWVAVAVSVLAAVLNALSRSAGERRIWVPVAVVMLISSLLVALSGGA